MKTFNKHLIEAANSKGMVVREVKERPDNGFGKVNLIVVEGSMHRITFISNVLHGTNYFQIVEVIDLNKGRTYRAHRYFTKFISLISSINGNTFTAMNKASK